MTALGGRGRSGAARRVLTAATLAMIGLSAAGAAAEETPSSIARPAEQGARSPDMMIAGLVLTGLGVTGVAVGVTGKAVGKPSNAANYTFWPMIVISSTVYLTGIPLVFAGAAPRRSRGDRYVGRRFTGMTLTVLGATFLGAAAGIIAWDLGDIHAHTEGYAAALAGTPLAASGLIFTVVGASLWGTSGRTDDPTKASAAPELTIGPGSIGVRGTF